MKRLEEICIFIRNGLNIKNDKSKKGIPVTRIETISNGIIDINKTGYANIFDDKYIDYYLRQDDILMSHINSLKHLGKVGYCYYDMKIIHGMNLLNIRVNPNNVYPKYLYYYFKSNNFKIKLNKISKQSVNQSSFSISDLKKIRIEIIDLERQKLIVTKLDKVVEVISIRKKQIEELNNLIKSQFVEMFSDKDFKKEKLKNNIIEMFIGPFGSALKNEYFVDKENGYSVVYEQKHAINKNIKEFRWVDKNKYKSLERFNVKPGDIIVSCRGTVGKTYIIPDDAPIGIMHPSIMKIRLKKEKYIPKFFEKVLEEYLEDKERETMGAIIKMGIKASQLEKEYFIIPDLSVQTKYLNIVKQIDKQKFESMIQLKMIEKIYNIINDRSRYV